MQFRTRTEPSESTESPKIEAPAVETKGLVSDKDGEAVGENFEPKRDALEDWEIRNGKYGLEYMGIKEIAKEFPAKMQFPYIDNFIKSEIKERGLDSTPENWQKILAEIEEEAGIDKKNSYERLKRLFDYIKLYNKFKTTKELKEKFKFS